jgi:uncharacterized coiled-coil DUF342 family protein
MEIKEMPILHEFAPIGAYYPANTKCAICGNWEADHGKTINLEPSQKKLCEMIIEKDMEIARLKKMLAMDNTATRLQEKDAEIARLKADAEDSYGRFLSASAHCEEYCEQIASLTKKAERYRKLKDRFKRVRANNPINGNWIRWESNNLYGDFNESLDDVIDKVPEVQS